MMYLFRIILFLIIPGIVFILIWKKLKKKKLILILSAVILFVFFSVSIVFPIERAFLRFETPEKAIRYFRLNERVLDVVYGDDSAMIIAANRKNDFAVDFVEKRDDGYIIPRFLATTRIQTSYPFQIERVDSVNDYYYYGLAVTEKESNVFDSNGNQAKSITVLANSTEMRFVLFYNYIENYDDSFSLVVEHADDPAS